MFTEIQVAFNENTTMYEVHAKGCKHLSGKKYMVYSHVYLGGDAQWVAKNFEENNDGCLTKISPCAKKVAA